MKIFIAIPCMDQVPAQFAQSLATLQKNGECVVAFQMGSLIYHSRDSLARKAIECEADYIFWLDSDMVFAPDTLTRLLEDRESGDIISGLYFRRVQPFSPVLFDRLDIDSGSKCEWTSFEKVPDEIFPIGGCGFGCVLMRTDILYEIASRFGALFAPIGSVGEDLSFCWRARQCGYKIVCDPSITLGHVGHHVITKEFFEAFSKRK